MADNACTNKIGHRLVAVHAATVSRPMNGPKTVHKRAHIDWAVAGNMPTYPRPKKTPESLPALIG